MQPTAFQVAIAPSKYYTTPAVVRYYYDAQTGVAYVVRVGRVLEAMLKAIEKI